MEPIKFILGEESRPKIETFSDVDHSLFKDQYEKAFEEIVSYVIDKPLQNDPNTENKNNLFAFIGERGSGKTSCMLSVANMLTTPHKEFVTTFKSDLTKKLDNEKFITIDLVDPSFFDHKHNIIDIVIAKLFKSFSDDIKKSTQNKLQNYEYKKQQVIDKFQETKENLNQLLNDNNISDDSLEQLTGLAAAVDLKDNLKNLFDSYLDYFLSIEHTNTKGYLVIKIDDIDLHTKHAYEMVEQIRKYIIQPNVIVLIAVKLDQLSNVIKLQYKKEFGRIISENDLEGMVDKYIVKLLPLSRRIYIPDTSIYINNSLEIRMNDSKKTIKKYNSIREAVLTLIFLKTRYLFYNTKGTTSYIVPRNLRELRHIIKLLIDLDNYRKQNRPEYNKVIFKKYLFETWVNYNLTNYHKNIIERVLSVNDAVNFNKNLLRELKGQYISAFSTVEKELQSITSEINVPYNISIGDVFSVISFLENRFTTEEDRKFFFLLKSIYSVKLYEYYDELTENNSTTLISDKEVFRSEFMKDYSNYDKIVSGNFINGILSDILPSRRIEISKSEVSRSNRLIQGKVFQELLKLLTDNHKSFIESEDKETFKIKYSNGEDYTYKSLLNIVEFFALNISRLDDTKKGYRIQNSVYYNENLTDVLNNLYFDATSYTHNLVDIKRCYKRFGPLLFEICKDEELSLLSNIYSLSRRYPERIHSLRSWCCIRNAEILEDFTTFLIKNKPKGTGGEDKKTLIAFYSNIQDYKIQTYDRDDENDNEDEPYEISFPFVATFITALSDIDNVIFDEIFTHESYLGRYIKVNQRLRVENSIEKIKERIIINNPQIEDKISLINLFDSIFTKTIYSKEEAKDKLEELKSKYNG
ncbi:MAG: hypothetical protein ACYC25_03160 [Paludibacter sp.]